ncbi:MAG: UDP-N-acetylmuramoyl-tripeptide--D-alanyl-D-alanine ligase [Clostridia bacterium]|nr:UDP-N-acetylmuramoyl-tripeptide--D-alanyl-D-alanine ligase [Clostridia bacterium]
MIIYLGKNSIGIREAAEKCGGKIIRDGSAGIPVSSVCTDSRDCVSGSLFLAIRGEKTDGHLYIPTAVKNGAAAVLCEYAPECDTGDAALILVDDTVKALGRLAGAYGEGSCPFRVAVTGSVGKTATKEMIYSVLSAGSRKAFRSEGNLNTVIGMPLSLLSAPADAYAGIFEMGLEQRGEISAMSCICRPRIAAVTVLGSSHIGHIGSREKLAFEKLSVADGLDADGTLFLPADEPLFAETAFKDKRTVTFSVSRDAGIRARNTVSDGETVSFDADCPAFGRYIGDLRLPVPGIHNASDALIAIGAGIVYGLSDDEIRAGIAAYRPVRLRQQVLSIAGTTFINDCYNASPESMAAAFRVHDELYRKRGSVGRKIAVLGDMYELGDDAPELHRLTGRRCAEAGTDILITVGSLGAEIAAGALERMDGKNVFAYPDVKDISAPLEALRGIIRKDDVVLIKASRGVGAERFAASLRDMAE